MMSAWIIYDKNGLAKCEARKLEYQGDFMGSCSVNVSITSPTPIGFELGDWLEYRGERFELNYDPSVVKESSSNTYGEGFQYENIVFNSLADELTRCDFLDYVLNDNEIHYSSLPTFSFFADSITKLAERIQANLDRIYTGDKKWTVEVHPEYVNTLNVNITANNNTVWDALGFVNTMFGANFIIRGRKITIGTTGLAVGQLFSYGKGNGLYKIERNAESNQKVITRLRAYGSTRNMPTDYYHNVSGGNIPNNMAVRNLMLPTFPVQTHDPYIDSVNISELGIREGTVFFDGSSELEEIYPTMEGMTAEELANAGIFVNATGALDEVEYSEGASDEGKFEEGADIPDFTIVLKDIGFDLNDYLGSSEAVISMKDGMCGGRDFEIVKCEREGDRYVLTCHRHYDAGLDLYFPYRDYQIYSGDKYVLLNIEMPDVYIKVASQKLLKAAEAYLAKNDYVRYSYTLSVDNIFMAKQHEEALKNGEKSIHDVIKEGDLMLFEDEDLGIDGSVTISSISIKEYSDESVIPEYNITLQDEKSVGTIERIQNQISNLAANGTGGSVNTEQVKSIIEAVGKKLFLSKTKDDRSKGTIASDKGFEVGRYKEGELGSGGIFKLDKDKNSYLEVDKMLVRKIAYFVEIMIKKLSHVGGSIILSPASMKCSKVEEYETYYRCYFENEHEGKTINQEFVVGDQARSQEFNIKEGLSQNVRNQYYWRLVVGAGSNYIDLSKADCDSGSGIPLAGDDIVQLGNRNNPERQNAIILSSYGEGTPSFRQYKKIHTYSMSDAELVTEFSPESNLITGKFISKSGKDLEEEFLEAKVDWDKVLEQTDKEFSMWFFPYAPSADVVPEVDWVTPELKALHEEDLFYDKSTGLAWRYTYENGYYFWEIVTDAETIKALEKASKAQETADGAVQRLDSIVSDGKLSAVEKKEVRKEWASIVDTYEWNMYSSERIGVDMDSSEVVAYSNAYNALSAYITPLLAEDGDSDINPDEYRGYWTDYYTAETKLRNLLSEKAKEKADDVNDRVDDIVSDGVLSAVEKKEVLKEWQSVVVQYTINKNDADKYELDYSDYTDAYHALGTYLNNGIAWTGSGTPLWLGTQIGVNTTLSSPTEYRKVWVDYYKAESILRERISEAGLGTRVRNFKTYPNELPVPPYNVGDRWMNAYYTVGGVTYAENDDMVCIQAKAKNEVASISDWKFSSGMNSDTKKDIEASIKNLGDRIELNVESIDALNKAYANLGIRIDGVAEEVAIYAKKTSDNETSIAELKLKTNSIEQSVSNTQGGVEEAKELASTARSLAITAAMTGMYSGEEYNQTTNPWQNWSSGTEYKHVGAIWYNPNTGVTKRYIGTDGTNSWETVDDNVYSSATFVFQNKSKWSVVAANFNDDGSVKGNSGIVTTSSYAALFSEQWNENESVRAEIGTFVTKNADGTLNSNVKITANNVDINGIVKVSGTNTVKIGGWTVEENKLYAETGLSFVGTIDDYSISIEPSGMKVSYGDDFITAEFGANYASISDWGGLSALNIVNHKSVGAVGYTKMCALRVKGDPNDMGIIVEGAACAFRPSSGAVTSIHGLAVNARSNSGSIQSNDDFVKVDRNTTLPSPVTLRGKILFVKCSGSYTLTVPSCVLDNESSSGSGSFKDDHMRAFISNGTYWFEMNLTDTW